MEELTGKTFGQYTLLSQLGEGGMAVVYRGQQASIGREVAIKVLPYMTSMLDDSMLERFNREVQIIAEMQHPHILPVHDFGVEHGQPYIVMALLPGGTLEDLLNVEGRLSLAETLRYTRQIAEALDYAHGKEVIHRDLKPSNVLLDGAPGDKRRNAYLADFGLATTVGSDRLTQPGAMVGTPAYMAPDWLSAEDEVTHSVDVYGLAVTVYEMLSGKVPYEGSSPMTTLFKHMSEPIPDVRALRPEVATPVSQVIRRGMAKLPEERYASAGDFIDALEHATRLTPHADLTPSVAVTSQFFYPNIWGRTIFEGVEEVYGKDRANGLLIQAELGQYIDNYPPNNLKKEFPFAHFGRLTEAAYTVYGKRGMQAVGRQAGMAAYRKGMQAQKGIQQIARAAIRAVAPNRQLWVGLEYMARMFNTLSDQRVELDETDEHYIWRITRCPICWGATADDPLGHFAIGFLIAAIEWTIGDASSLRIVETECIAQGAEQGTFLIEKASLP